MTVPHERTLALRRTRQLLSDLSEPGKTRNVPEEIRRVATRLLRHFPEPSTVDLTAAVLPQWWAAETETRPGAFCYLELLGLATELAGDQDLAQLLAERRERMRLHPDGDGPAHSDAVLG